MSDWTGPTGTDGVLVGGPTYCLPSLDEPCGSCHRCTDPGAEQTALPVDDLTCPATSDGGRLRCIKPKYRARNGEAWEHGGGHFFATEEGARRLATGHFDALEVSRARRKAAKDKLPERLTYAASPSLVG